ncbi:unnamed protein product [Ranitomeya imitator]|uniref:Small nuclear ribonucleoprotein Sm D3 n=1 Tax=Ranitomeya imitator TaxID=111125 RepID=A0ABN9MIY6_9NEOB|nr:unnamed protein product [Ranitomeya imitator]
MYPGDHTSVVLEDVLEKRRRGCTLSSVTMSIGVPIKVLHEAEGHIVTCETNTGEVYRGKLIEAEDNMNCQMSNITVTYRDGRVAQLEQVYIRGSKIRFLILPDMLKNAPMLKSMKNKNQGSGAGRGKAAILKAQEMGKPKVVKGISISTSDSPAPGQKLVNPMPIKGRNAEEQQSECVDVNALAAHLKSELEWPCGRREDNEARRQCYLLGSVHPIA